MRSARGRSTGSSSLVILAPFGGPDGGGGGGFGDSMLLVMRPCPIGVLEFIELVAKHSLFSGVGVVNTA